jgi:hypothetical protein
MRLLMGEPFALRFQKEVFKLMKSLSFITHKRLCGRREPLFRVLLRLEDAGVNASFLVSIPLVPVRSGWGSFVQ